MTRDSWECAELSEAPQDWILATENGWGALVIWAAGPSNVARVHRASPDRFGLIVHRLPGGAEQRQPFRLTEADQASVDDDIDIYLAEAGIPPRPRGFDWFIRRPPNDDLDDETFWGLVWTATTARLPGDGLRPSTMAGPANEAMASLYRD
ncbi:DUF5956 family protein [Paenarthrobacter aurescens]|uniref:Uncharacterized protein n=1 Tax=Paenarthrobacter aurescens TaxID=43663 RepID=A0A4Y3NFF3_PAEAU|nr:DUF5956 family protein [Paenarthrobacter aurescens]MDO6144891.1 hypothetical protein [Paenarthrobacter aurescens]MDO6148736.1 hypothetical protein [Paenarthrobacter aurescens]MDO6159982.1 hypothetical protein [Paenarthrobacter aurescens]MDO6163841.1 hypothetical protein [Paenarthrobacter aurescens]GEB17449.1 hypothetical protein AAU01_02040 [Paenarthrobacter aurescens]